MTMNHAELYKFAEYYDIAFDFRDVPAECDFLASLVQKHLGRAPRSFLELGAGPAQHALEFARRGLTCSALDLAQEMVDYTAGKAREQKISLNAIRADMEEFTLEGSYDLAALLMNSAVYLLDNTAVLRHFDAVARHLNDGGLYILEMSHPRDIFGIDRSTQNEWTMTRGETRVWMEWGRHDDAFDPITQLTDVTVSMRFEGPGGSGGIKVVSPERCFTANELKALVAASGRFRIVDEYGAMNQAVPFNNDEAAWRMVAVLQKMKTGIPFAEDQCR
ncbi:MAG: methyltransferase domain-containing protein [Candidatus Eisenbacteria bacterium]|nr:methyltransferase domain-containing protein [Candidatus Eisenbacteria bacterium]